MNKRLPIAILLTMLLLSVACSHKEQTTSTTSSETSAAPGASTEAVTTPAAMATNGPTFVTFNFTDVAITSSAAPLLRLGFDMKNNGKDPLLCDPTEFSVQLSDGSTIPADTGAEDTCTPDTIDPNTTGKVVMYFDLKNAYSGPITLLMSVNNAVVGRSTTQVH